MSPREPLPRHKDISTERLVSGGLRLSVVYAGQLRQCRYFDYPLREAKRAFIAELRAGLVP